MSACLPLGKIDPPAMPLGSATRVHIGALPATCDPDALLFPRFAEDRGPSSLATC